MKLENVEIYADDLPHDCHECPFAIDGTVWQGGEGNDWVNSKFLWECFVTHKAMTGTKRNRFCPLKLKGEKNA